MSDSMEVEPLNREAVLEFGSGLWVDMMLKVMKKSVEKTISGDMSCKNNVSE